MGQDGAYHDVTVPLPAWAAATGGGGGASAPAGAMPATTYAQRVQQYETRREIPPL